MSVGDNLYYGALFILVFLAGGAYIGATNSEAYWRTDFVGRYKDKPYCVESKIAEKEYKRCWVAKEVEP